MLKSIGFEFQGSFYCVLSLSPLSDFEVSVSVHCCARFKALRQSGGGGHIVHIQAEKSRETNDDLLLHLFIRYMNAQHIHIYVCNVDGLETTLFRCQYPYL